MIIKNEKNKLFCLMLIGYIILLIGVVNSYPLHTSTDELGAIVSAARLAGFDWSGVISNSGYYGFGYYSLFFWLFKITDLPLIIYRCIISLTALMRILVMPIAYYLLKEYLGVKPGVFLYSVSLLMPFLHTSTVGLISNEYILELMTWLIIFLMCKVTQYANSRKMIIYTLLLLAACMYSLLIHTRAFTLLIAVIMVFGVWGVINKKKVKILGVVCGILLTYIVAQKFITIYQKYIYGVSGSGVRNGTVTVSHAFSLLNMKTWDVWFHMLIGLLGTEIIITGGLFLLGVLVVIYYLMHLLKSKQTLLSVQGNMILAVTIICIGATIAAFLVSGWFEGMLTTWGEEGAGKNYAYKGLAYVRYWNIYVPPFILCTLVLLTKIEYKKIINISILALAVMYTLYINEVIPLMKDNTSCASFLFGIGHYETEFNASTEYYLKCIAISLFFTFFAFWIVQTKHKQFVLIPFLILMISFHVNEQTEYNSEIKKRMSSKILASYDEKCKLEDCGVEIGTVYLNDETTGTDQNWKIYSVAQFYFNRYTLQMELPDKMEQNDIVISVGRSSSVESLYDNIKCYVLDDNEVWYTYLELDDYSQVNIVGVNH